MRLIVAIMLAASLPTYAQYKCVQTNGSVSFQQTPCASQEKSERINIRTHPLPDTTERPIEIRQALAARRAVVGMTRAELERAMGRPNKVNLAQYGSEMKDQLIYYTTDRTIYVYTHNYVVTAIQNTAGGEPKVYTAPEVQRKRCPSSSEIWELEIEISKLQNRGNQALQVELHKQLREAKSCGR